MLQFLIQILKVRKFLYGTFLEFFTLNNSILLCFNCLIIIFDLLDLCIDQVYAGTHDNNKIIKDKVSA